MTCDFGKQNDIIKCKCDVVMTADLGNLQSVPESLAITKLSRITCRISLEKRKDKIRSCGKRGESTCIFSTRAVPQDLKPVSSLSYQTGKCQNVFCFTSWYAVSHGRLISYNFIEMRRKDILLFLFVIISDFASRLTVAGMCKKYFRNRRGKVNFIVCCVLGLASWRVKGPHFSFRS